VIEVKLTFLDCSHDLIVVLTVERRSAGHNDVGNDTAAPDVALCTICLTEDLGSNIVRCTQLLGKLSGVGGVVDKTGTEINDLDLVESLVGFEENVLGLKISMNDVSLMTVVNAGQNSFHKDGSIMFIELATSNDLIKELTTLAKLSNNVVALLIFKVLIHFDDVRVIDILENINLIKKHSLFILVHSSFVKHFNGTFGSRVPILGNSNLTERTFDKNLAYFVEIAQLTIVLSNKHGMSNVYLFDHLENCC